MSEFPQEDRLVAEDLVARLAPQEPNFEGLGDFADMQPDHLIASVDGIAGEKDLAASVIPTDDALLAKPKPHDNRMNRSTIDDPTQLQRKHGTAIPHRCMSSPSMSNIKQSSDKPSGKAEPALDAVDLRQQELARQAETRITLAAMAILSRRGKPYLSNQAMLDSIRTAAKLSEDTVEGREEAEYLIRALIQQHIVSYTTNREGASRLTVTEQGKEHIKVRLAQARQAVATKRS